MNIIKKIMNYDKLEKEHYELSKRVLKLEQDSGRTMIKNSDLQKQIIKLNNFNNELQKQIEEQEQKYNELEEKRRKVAGKAGGLTKMVNKLEKELQDTTKRLESTEIRLKDSMTDKYIKKTLKPVKAPKTRLNAVSKKMKPQVRKYMMEEFGK